MAYTAGSLSKIVEMGVNGATLWFYPTLDAAATVAASGYFTSDAVNMLRIGDVILRETVGGTVAVPTSVTTYGFHVVLTNDGTTVDISDSSSQSVGTSVVNT